MERLSLKVKDAIIYLQLDSSAHMPFLSLLNDKTKEIKKITAVGKCLDGKHVISYTHIVMWSELRKDDGKHVIYKLYVCVV